MSHAKRRANWRGPTLGHTAERSRFFPSISLGIAYVENDRPKDTKIVTVTTTTTTVW